MKISYRISLAIIITATLHIIGLAAYIFDIIPIEVQKVYYYNLDRIYIISLGILFYLLSVSNPLKLTLLVSTIIHIVVTLIINLKYFVTLSYKTSESIWIIALGGSLIACLITLKYVSK